MAARERTRVQGKGPGRDSQSPGSKRRGWTGCFPDTTLREHEGGRHERYRWEAPGNGCQKDCQEGSDKQLRRRQSGHSSCCSGTLRESTRYYRKIRSKGDVCSVSTRR